MTAFFELTGVRKSFGGLIAVNDLSFAIEPGAIVSMIGPNGAGKSTVFNLVTGLYAPNAGSLTFEGRLIGGLRTVLVTALGIVAPVRHLRLLDFLSPSDYVINRHPHAVD